MFIGADYYPEHWPRSRWKTDAKLMEKAGFNVVRLAEFAWVNMEPEEGRFEFEWLDEVLDLMAGHGISAILCTPTAAMPAWVPRKYPEVLATRADGQTLPWGIRKNNCFSSGAYRLLSERITVAMAEHFAETPNVIGWQSDNEFADPECYCDSCRNDFHDFLRMRFQTLDDLNRCLGTHFWGHEYRAWGEIQIPRENHNPSLCLEWRRFFSWQNVRFQRDQVRILRELCPRHFVTHNFMGFTEPVDYYHLAEDLDHASWDNYPICDWAPPEPHYQAAAVADQIRGLKGGKGFWIMAQTAGPSGWGVFSRNPRPGEIRKIAYQQLAHGCEGQVWFRWRTCTAGREQYWHGLLGHDGRPLRRYKEAAATAQEYHKLAPDLDGTAFKGQVAILWDYVSLWAIRIQPSFGANRFQDAVMRYYRALLRAGVNVDIVSVDADWSGYKAVFAPDLYVLPDELAERLVQYVEGGGVLLTDCRTGVKDETNLCHERTLPGLLTDVLGVVIEEYESIPTGGEYAVVGKGGFEGSYTATMYADWAKAGSAEVLAGYEAWHMKRFAAVTRNGCGEGKAYYVGTIFAEESFYDAVVGDVMTSAKVRPVLTPPPGVEACVRQGKGTKLLFLINHTEQTQRVGVPQGKKELLSDSETGSEIELDVFGVAVIKL